MVGAGMLLLCVGDEDALPPALTVVILQWRLREVAMERSSEDDVLLALARTVVAISTRAADQLGGISVVQLRALTVLREVGTVNLGRVAEEMGVALSTASRLVDRLVRAGLVDRR